MGNFICLLVGTFVGVVLAFTTFLVSTPYTISEQHKMLESCQAELPRDKFCKLIAVVEDAANRQENEQ